MDTYKVILSPHAYAQIVDHHDYLRFSLLNEQAAESMWRDAFETVRRLSAVAGSLRFCRTYELRKRGYRLIRFKSHRYVMIYRVEAQTVLIEAVYHELQSYESLFLKNLNV